MMSREFIGRSFGTLVAAGTLFLAATTAQAAMLPAPVSAGSDVQTVACLLGAHVGPAGVCIGGYHHHHCWINHWGRRVCN